MSGGTQPVCGAAIVAGTCVAGLPATSGSTLGMVMNVIILGGAATVVLGVIALNIYKKLAK
jgi:hypothetical protein